MNPIYHASTGNVANCAAAVVASGSFTQLDALRFALDGLDVPVLYDIDFGHVPPQMALVNGALATVTLAGTAGTLVQSLL